MIKQYSSKENQENHKEFRVAANFWGKEKLCNERGMYWDVLFLKMGGEIFTSFLYFCNTVL